MNKCFIGDCRDVMRTLIEGGGKVQSIVTSPPYWGLRDYGVAGQLGLEATPQEYVERMVEVFRLAREMLADDGTLWLNLGDSYCGSWGNYGGQNRTAGKQRAISAGSRVPNPAWDERTKFKPAAATPPEGLKNKDLVGIPWRVAFALQADGWYLRQDIIWHKPNPMPESVTDRCTKAHEYLFLLTKRERYYYDAEAIKEPASENTNPRRAGNGYKTPDGWDTSKGQGGHGSFHKQGREDGHTDYQHKRHVPGNKTHKGTTAYENGADEHRTKGGLVKYATKMRKLAASGSGVKNNDSFDAAMAVMPDTRNKRSVWTVATQPYSEAHFATFPPSLIEPCILAGSRIGDVVFDPFFGSGTTGEVAERLGRQWIGAELNPAYEPLQKKRTAQTGMAL